MASKNVSYELLRQLTESRQVVAAKEGAILHSGGGDGTSGDMEARIKRLEDDGKELRGDLKAIIRDLAEIKGRVATMPTTWNILQINAALLALILAVGGALLAWLHAIGKI